MLLVAERGDPRRPLSAGLRSLRPGVWARLLALSRAIHAGDPVTRGLLPPGGRLFDPHAHPFLEGRPAGDRGPLPDPGALPPIPDAVVRRVLRRLAPPAGAALDVARIGAAYEALLGLELSPDPAGGLALRAGEARRRAGAHYTSPAMARVIVGRALAPLLGPEPTAAQILDLRVCDPAMGAGAFLLEACDALADALVRAWDRAGAAPPIAGRGDYLARARWLTARHCLHGVDKNPLAVDLARLSLGLHAGAPGLPPPFLDHALRAGDAVMGLDRAQIAALSLRPGRGAGSATAAAAVDAAMTEAAAHRRAIRAGDPAPGEALARADRAMGPARALGDAVLATFLHAESRRARPRALAALPRALGADGGAALPPDLAARVAALREAHAPFHWEIEFPEVFADRAGFDALVGNPPWVAFAGRAAQPIPPALRDLHAAQSSAFAGYRTLHGLFVHRAAALLRPGGRLGLVLPTSIADLAGYAPVRRAHDALCAADPALPDFGDRAFEGVFQPSMGLLSTRRPAEPPCAPAPRAPAPSSGWPLARSDLDAATASLLARLDALPRLPPRLFGERGFQSHGEDARHFAERPEGARAVGLRVGGDIGPCARRPPSLYCDPTAFGARFRPAPDWQAVRLLIRQTARFPMAALADGLPFRNSILAGFEDERYGAHFLLAYLNSTPVRWYHYQRQRDARQGMPQVKIAHLRALPAPPADHPAVAALAALGRALGERNGGITGAEQEAIDHLAGEALSFDEGAWAQVRCARGQSNSFDFKDLT